MQHKNGGGSLAKGTYRIFVTERFTQDLVALGHANHAKIQQKLLEYVYPQLKAEPHFGANIKRLKNWDPPTWRYRVGSWRFFYEIDKNARIVFLTVASHRRDAYR